MKTREVRLDSGSNSNGASDILNSLPKPAPIEQKKPVSMADVASLLKAPPVTNNTSRVTIEQATVEDVPRVNTTPQYMDESWVRQDLVSRQIPYDNKEIFFKTLNLPSLAKLRVAKDNNSITTLIDALAPSVSVDIRNLTPEDFTHAMYWIRDNSLPRSPMTVSYRTRYNNVIKVNTRLSNLKIKALDMSEDQYAEWRAKGIVFPTVRDMELLTNFVEIDSERKWLLEYAQYVEYIPGEGVTDYSDYVEAKLARLEHLTQVNGLEFLAEIDKFSTLLDYGVIERVTVSDTEFDPESAIEFFKSEAAELNRLVSEMSTEEILSSSKHIITLTEAAKNYITEANELQAKLDNGERIVPEKEVVKVDISLTSFFPRV